MAPFILYTKIDAKIRIISSKNGPKIATCTRTTSLSPKRPIAESSQNFKTLSPKRPIFLSPKSRVAESSHRRIVQSVRFSSPNRRRRIVRRRIGVAETSHSAHFKARVRVNRDTFEYILEEIRPDIIKTPTNFEPHPIEPHRQLGLINPLPTGSCMRLPSNRGCVWRF